MGRPIYSYEMSDPDFSWLISNFRENHPNFTCVETVGIPVVLVSTDPDSLGIVRQRSPDELMEPPSRPPNEVSQKHESK